MYDFGKAWGAEIADVSERPEYQSAVIRVTSADTDDTGYYDIGTGTWTGGKDPEVLFEGPARFAPIRWGVDARDTHLANASTTTRLRFQVPYAALQRDVPRGSLVEILAAPRAEHMVGETATVVGDIQNSSNASRSLETEWNSDVRGKK